MTKERSRDRHRHKKTFSGLVVSFRDKECDRFLRLKQFLEEKLLRIKDVQLTLRAMNLLLT